MTSNSTPAQGSEPSRNAKSNRRTFVRWAIATVGVVLLGGVVWSSVYLDGIAKDANCKTRLRGLCSAVFTDDSPPRLLVDANPKNATGPNVFWHCPKCREVYEYRPFEGPVQLDSGTGDIKLRVIAWCPAPCHGGRRNILVETGTPISISEASFRKLESAGFSATLKELVNMANMD